MALPNLLLIGALKSGTTSLHRYLAAHPEVQMAEAKELNFLVRPEDCLVPQGEWDRGRDWYESWFSAEFPVRGESSHHYTAHPVVRGVPERAAELVPEARLIYLVRDPIERIVSHYLERRIAGLETRPFEEAMEEALADPEPNSYVCRSRYAMQIERWLERFPADRILVLGFEDMRDRRAETLAHAFRFLGVDDAFVADEFEVNVNPTIERREPRPALAGADRLRQARGRRMRIARARRLLPPRARALVRAGWNRLATRPTERPEPSSDTRERLAGLLREDAERLRRLTGERFPSWSV